MWKLRSKLQINLILYFEQGILRVLASGLSDIEYTNLLTCSLRIVAMWLEDERVLGIWLWGSDSYASSKDFVVLTFYVHRHRILVS